MDEKKLVKIAIDYLSKYDSSKKNLFHVLKRKVLRLKLTNIEKGKLINLLDKIILDLENKNLINDKRYIESKINTLSNSGKSKNYILNYIIKKGISKNDVLYILDEFEKSNYDWELKSAEIFVRKKRLLKLDLSYEKKLAKMARAGFSYEICRKLLD